MPRWKGHKGPVPSDPQALLELVEKAAKHSSSKAMKAIYKQQLVRSIKLREALDINKIYIKTTTRQ
jgi:hypothetical protein